MKILRNFNWGQLKTLTSKNVRLSIVRPKVRSGNIQACAIFTICSSQGQETGGLRQETGGQGQETGAGEKAEL